MLRLDSEHDLRIGGQFQRAEPGQLLKIKFEALHGARNTPDTLASIAGVALPEDPEVADPANVAHMLSNSAVELLAVSLNTPAFSSDATGLLFPPDTPAAGGATSVRGTREWAFFRRRRTITCAGGATTPTPTPVAAARFEVYALATSDAKVIDKLASALNSPSISPLGASTLKRIGHVEFAGATADLETTAAAIKAFWQASAPGEQMRLSAIGEHAGAAGDAGLLEKRLLRVLDAVESITPAATNLAPTILTSVPPSLAVPGSDGVIVLASLVEHKTTCVSVFRVPPRITTRFRDLMNSGKREDAIALLSGSPSTTPPSVVTFAEGEDEIESGLETLRAWWEDPGTGVGTVYSAQLGVWTATAENLLQARARAILVGIDEPDAILLDSPDTVATLPGRCPAAVFLAPPEPIAGPATTMCMTVLRVPSEDGAAADFLRLLNGDDPEAALAAGLATGTPLGRVIFAETDALLGTGSLIADVTTAWSGLADRALETVTVMSHVGNTAAGEPNLREARGRAISTAVGGGASVPIRAAQVTDRTTWPLECPAVAFLVGTPEVVVPVQTCHTVRLVKKTALGRFIKWIDENGELVTVNFLVEDPTFETSHDLGPARFADDSADVLVDDIAGLKAKFAQNQGAPVISVTVLSMAGDLRVGSETVRTERAQAILALLEIDTDAITLSESETPLPGTCPVITLLVPDVSKIEAGGG